MGKRRRRLNSPKFAKKYAKVRETYNRLRGVIEDAKADGVITPEEVKVIEEAKQEVVKALEDGVATPVEETKTEEASQLVTEPALEIKPEPVVPAPQKSSFSNTTRRSTARKTTARKAPARKKAAKATKKPSTKD